MEDADPITQFFDADEASSPDLLYTTLQLDRSASSTDIRKAYRRLALVHHPDKHSSKSEAEKEEAARLFQRIGFAYAILSDDAKRKTYDATGSTKESAFADAEEMGWDKYFEMLFTRIDRKVLDEDKQKYQGGLIRSFSSLIAGSEDEVADLKEAYTSCKGSLPAILERIPHATHDDEQRLVKVVNELIADGSLESTKKWTATSTDKAAKSKRAKAAASQAKEAEAAAKELGVWDEFYGSGKKGKRNGEKDESGLQALILKRQQDRSGALDALADKYAKLDEKERAKGKGKNKKRKSEQVS